VSRGRLRKTCPWHCSFFQPYRLREPSTALASNTHTGITSPNPRPRTTRTRSESGAAGVTSYALRLEATQVTTFASSQVAAETRGSPTDANARCPRPEAVSTVAQDSHLLPSRQLPIFTTFRTSEQSRGGGPETPDPSTLTYAGRCLRFSVQSPRSRQGRGRMA
jgi:hypothetical protein